MIEPSIHCYAFKTRSIKSNVGLTTGNPTYICCWRVKAKMRHKGWVRWFSSPSPDLQRSHDFRREVVVAKEKCLIQKVRLKLATKSYKELPARFLPLVSAYLLISHGSRDPRPQEAVSQLAAEFKRRLDDPQANSQGLRQLSLRAQPTADNRKELEYNSIGQPSSTLAPPQSLVGTATLELSILPLDEQIYQFGRSAIAAGCKHLQILPLFLLPGVHVIEDIPAAVALAQTALGRDLQIDLQPHIGDRPHCQQLFVDRMTVLGGEKQILLSHGSRRPSGNQPVVDLAARTGAEVAYWSMSPTLAERVTSLVEMGYCQIAIQPYFLFAGGITDAIDREVKNLRQQFPQTELILGEAIEWPSLLEAIAISYG